MQAQPMIAKSLGMSEMGQIYNVGYGCACLAIAVPATIAWMSMSGHNCASMDSASEDPNQSC